MGHLQGSAKGDIQSVCASENPLILILINNFEFSLISFLFYFFQSSCDTLAAVAAKEIETLKQTLQEKESHILVMEQVCLTESEHQAELEDSIIAWQDKYDRLYESHKRVQKVNQGLEDKLLKLVDRNSGERAQLTSDVATLSVRLAQANFNISKLQREIVSTSIILS